MLSHYLLLPKIFVYSKQGANPKSRKQKKKKGWLLLQTPQRRDDGEGPRPPRRRCLAAPPASWSRLLLGGPRTAGPLVTARRRSLPEAHPQTGRGRTGRRPQPRVCAARRVRRFPGNYRRPPWPGRAPLRGLSQLARRTARPRGRGRARGRQADPCPGGSSCSWAGTQIWKIGRSPTLSGLRGRRRGAGPKNRHVLAPRSPRGAQPPFPQRREGESATGC